MFIHLNMLSKRNEIEEQRKTNANSNFSMPPRLSRAVNQRPRGSSPIKNLIKWGLIARAKLKTIVFRRFAFLIKTLRSFVNQERAYCHRRAWLSESTCMHEGRKWYAALVRSWQRLSKRFFPGCVNSQPQPRDSQNEGSRTLGVAFLSNSVISSHLVWLARRAKLCELSGTGEARRGLRGRSVESVIPN